MGTHVRAKACEMLPDADRDSARRKSDQTIRWSAKGVEFELENGNGAHTYNVLDDLFGRRGVMRSVFLQRM